MNEHEDKMGDNDFYQELSDYRCNRAFSGGSFDGLPYRSRVFYSGYECGSIGQRQPENSYNLISECSSG